LGIRHLKEAAHYKHQDHTSKRCHKCDLELCKTQTTSLFREIRYDKWILSVIKEDSTYKPEYGDIAIEECPSHMPGRQYARDIYKTHYETAIDYQVFESKEAFLPLEFHLLEHIFHALVEFLIR
jgi:hypothetical protein